MESAPCSMLRMEVLKMQIGEFSKKTGLTIDTLRYYNKIGLLVPQKAGSRRCYTEGDLEKVNIIKKLKNLYFTLDEIKMLFILDKDTEVINKNNILNSEDREKIDCSLNMIKEKYKNIISREQELVQVKLVLSRMIDKANKLLQSGSTKHTEDKSAGYGIIEKQEMI